MIRTRLDKWQLNRKNKKHAKNMAATNPIEPMDRDFIGNGTENTVLAIGRNVVRDSVQEDTNGPLGVQSLLRQENPLVYNYTTAHRGLNQLWSTSPFLDLVPRASLDASIQDGDWQFPDSDRNWVDTSPWTFIQDPNQSNYDQALSNMQNYCISYAGSADSLKHREPRVHRETKHAIFAQQMQDGLAFVNINNEKAFANMNKAFDTLAYAFRDPCPMNLALIMVVICTLERQRAKDIQGMLLRHLRELTATRPISHPWALLFDALVQSPDAVTDVVLRCMRIARDELVRCLSRGDWKTLYLEERLCDCLYYMRVDGERIETRRALLRAQETYYGSDARNVLWTLTNVADDLLQQTLFTESSIAYQEALNRAEAHRDYDRAKTRFAALEGLADCQLASVGVLRWPHEHWPTVQFNEGMDRNAFRTALDYLVAAEREAQTWFDVSSHRVLRIQRKKQGLLALEL